jgi:Uma2 family endonuclease
MAQPAEQLSGGVFVPYGRWTAQRALEELPETPEATVEVFDGSVVVSPRPSGKHQRALRVLGFRLDEAARAVGLEAMLEINLVLGEDLASPDITVLPRDGEDHVWFDAADAVLVVEIMSPNHKRKDRLERPGVYAGSGVPYYMRVEFRGDDPVVFLHRLTHKGEYQQVMVGAGGSLFVMRDPFPFCIDPMDLLDH